MSRMNERGVIFNIQHFCIHDGPGIRTTIFLKGCPLRCLWCANPESQKIRTQIFWEREKCSLCGRCEQNCLQGAIYREGERMCTDWAACTGCGVCTDVCPERARALCGKEKSVDEVMEEILEDRIFYGTDGGITLSGGEPAMQPTFVLAILKRAKQEGITTAMETCGYAPEENYRSLAEYCDTFLYDLKVMDSKRHQDLTGRDNQQILENLHQINLEFPDCDIWIRIPVIPDYNDDYENLEAIGKLAGNLQNCSQVHLLPYHNLGEGKRQQLGESPFMAVTPDNRKMEELRALVKKAGNGIMVK